MLICISARAAERIKLDNVVNLNSAGSWTGGSLPNLGDVAVWNNTVTGPNSTILGADVAWSGIKIVGPGGLVTIGTGNTLTLAANGIDMNAATQDLIIQSGVRLSAAQGQIWNVAAGRTLTLNTGAFSRTTAATLNVQGSGTVSATSIANDSTGIIGNWATFGTGTAARYAAMNAGNVVGFTGGVAAATAAAVTDTTGLVHYDVAAVGAVGAGASFNTLRYTGGAGTITGNFSANGILTAGTGALILSGNITVGSSRELVLTTGDSNSLRNLTLSGMISDSAAGPSAVIKAGSGTVTLSGANSYSGITYVTKGRLSIANNSALGSTDAGTRLGQAGTLSLPGGINTAESIYFDDFVNAFSGGVLMENIGTNTLTGAVRVSSSTRWQSAGTQLNVTGGISTTGGTTGSFLVMQAATLMSITGKPISNGTGELYMDNTGRTIALGVVGNTYGSHAMYAGTMRTDVTNALNPSAAIKFGVNYNATAATLDLNGNSQTVGGISSGIFLVTGSFDRTITSGTAATLTVNQSTSATFDGRFSGAVSLDKNGAGTLTLSGASTTTGGFIVNGGTLTQNFARASAGASGAASVADYLPSAQPLTLGGGVFNLTGRNNGTVTSLAGATWDNLAASNGGSLITVTSTASLAPGQFISGGTGLPAGAYVVSIISGTQFVINANTTAAQTATTISATANSFTTSQTFSGLTLNAGASGLTVTIPTSGSDGTVLNLGAITPNLGATVNFTLPTGAQSSSNGITTTTTNTNGILGGWARAGNDWASNNGTNNIVAYAGYTDITRLSSGTKVITSDATSNVRIIEGAGTAGNNTPAAAGTTDIHTLLMSGTGGGATYDPGTSDVLRLGAAGGIMVASNAGALVMGTTANDGILTAGGAADIAGVVHVTNNHPSNAITINSIIANNGTGVVSLVTSGPGITVLNGNNTYTGRTVVGGAGNGTGSGTLRISSEQNLGNNPSSFAADQLTIAGGTLNVTTTMSLDDTNRGITLAPSYGSAINVNASQVLTVANSITGTGDLTLNGSGTVALTGSNTHSGITRMTKDVGTLALGHVNALQNSTLDVAASGTQTLTFTVPGTNTYLLGGLQGGDSIALGANSISVGSNNITTTYTGSISGSGGLTKTGNGTLNLSAANTFSGDTLMVGGMLVLANANALQNSTLDTGVAGNQSANLTMPEGTTYNIGGLKGSADFDLALSHLSVGSNNQSTTFGGVLKGAFNNNITKTGAGTLTLSGANTYTGSTLVSSGALQVGNAGTGQTGSGAVTVSSGATLLGSGTVRGSSVVLTNGSTLRPGDTAADSSHATLTFTPVTKGDHAIQTGSFVLLGISSATTTDAAYGGNALGSPGYDTWVDGIAGTGSHDRLVFNGSAGTILTFGGAVQVLGSGYTPQQGDVFNLIDWLSLVNADFSGFNVGTNYRDGSGDNASQFDLPDISSSGLVWDVSRFTTSGNIVVVPEPSRAMLMLFAFCTMLYRRRKRPS